MNAFLKNKNVRPVHFMIVALFFTLQACKSKSGDNQDYYSADDFSSLKKIDVHAHVMTANPAMVEQAIKDNFMLTSVNVEAPGLPRIDSQQYFVLQQRHKFPKDIFLVTTFETANINQPGWVDRQLAYLKNSFDSGAIGIKVWKNIGMTIRDKDSNFIMIDNPIFDPIFDYLEKNNIPVIGHIGEPKNCWLPLDQMTTNNDRSYFKEHPEYHMYLHPDYPSYEAQIRSRDHLLEKHPNLKFIGAHLGSLEWNVDEIANRLDKFPNMSVEPAERLGQIQFQSLTDWQKVHDFFIKYQDRIMYGTDLSAMENDNADSVRQHVHEIWTRDWKYFTTADSLKSPQVNKTYKGLQLPRVVIDKIYFKNAQKWYFAKKM
jgi:predicted TIM-barrel fold metal-dependent hydrolase